VPGEAPGSESGVANGGEGASNCKLREKVLRLRSLIAASGGDSVTGPRADVKDASQIKGCIFGDYKGVTCHQLRRSLAFCRAHRAK